MRMNLLATLALAPSLLAVMPSCTTQPDDELGTESAADGEDGKGDAAGAFTFYTVTADLRACSLNSPGDCGVGFFVARANRSSTQCGRGAAQSQCKVMTIDWAGTAMPSSVAKSYETSLRSGKPLIVRGSLVPAANDAGTTLAAQEIWVANKPESEAGVFTLVHDNGIRCVRAPCPSLTERRLNSNLSAQLTSVDFDASGATPSAVELAREAMFGDGLIIVGYRGYDGEGGKTRSADKFYTRAPVPLH